MLFYTDPESRAFSSDAYLLKTCIMNSCSYSLKLVQGRLQSLAILIGSSIKNALEPKGCKSHQLFGVLHFHTVRREAGVNFLCIMLHHLQCR